MCGLRLRIVFLALTLLTIRPVVAAEFDTIVGESQVIFRGTVLKLGASTIFAIAGMKDTAIVRVDKIFQAPAVLGNLEGQRITLLLKTHATTKVNDQPVFFATSWLYGESIALKEVGRLGAGESAEFTSEKLAAARARLDEQQMKARFESAELVVTGRVIDTKPGPITLRSPTPPSEHDPDLWLATVQIAEVLKGRAEGEVSFLFANSRDVQWMQAPKFAKGDEGVFLLRSAKIPAVPTGEFLTLLDPRDFLTPKTAERLKKLRP